MDTLEMKRDNLFWGIVIVVLGVLFLLNTLGIVSFDIWQYFWPIALIALGLWFLLGPIFYKSPPSTELSIPLGEIRSARFRLRHGAGKLHLTSGTAPDELVAGVFVGGVEKSVHTVGDETSIDLSTPSFSFPWGPQGLKWEIRLNPLPVLELTVETGASELHFDLSELQVSHFELSTGASSTTLHLPAHTAFTRAKIEGGAASFKIYVPEQVAARIHFDGSLMDFQVDQNRFPKSENVYVSPNFEESDHTVEIEFNGGVGSVSIL